MVIRGNSVRSPNCAPATNGGHFSTSKTRFGGTIFCLLQFFLMLHRIPSFPGIFQVQRIPGVLQVCAPHRCSCSCPRRVYSRLPMQQCGNTGPSFISDKSPESLGKSTPRTTETTGKKQPVSGFNTRVHINEMNQSRA